MHFRFGASRCKPPARRPFLLCRLSGLLLLWPIIGFAAPPADHPSPADAIRMMRPSGPESSHGQSHTAVILDTIDANEYTYAEVDESGTVFWIAAARQPLNRGDLIQFEAGVTMAPFYSKKLQREFGAVMFVDRLTFPGRK